MRAAYFASLYDAADSRALSSSSAADLYAPQLGGDAAADFLPSLTTNHKRNLRKRRLRERGAPSSVMRTAGQMMEANLAAFPRRKRPESIRRAEAQRRGAKAKVARTTARAAAAASATTAADAADDATTPPHHNHRMNDQDDVSSYSGRSSSP